jgi:hypothetical protein
MCDGCGKETIYHVPGERGVDRETCWCKCHDRASDTGTLLCGATRDDEAAALTACLRCRWAHVVAFSTKNWRNDERYMRPPIAPAFPETIPTASEGEE